LELITLDLGELPEDEVEIAVDHCSICAADLSMLDDAWEETVYPFVPGHEVVGRVVAVGARAGRLQVGQRVAIGWIRGSCVQCDRCLGGDAHLCQERQNTVIGHHGGFAERVRAHWAWAIPVPEALDFRDASPLACAGIAVFAPLVEHRVSPTSRVGVVGIGGLGHLAVKFLRAWGCEVVALTSNASKRQALEAMGAHRVVDLADGASLAEWRGQLDFLLVTTDAQLDWEALLGTLAVRGRMHCVGTVLDPIALPVLNLIGRRLSVSGSSTGSPGTFEQMLAFAARHHLLPEVEHLPMSRINEAFAKVRAGKARYRVVLDNDFRPIDP
jgi:uncharacterized zinc-type alcohol dehydrogenase-like protein